jgi:hypothetical protein
LLARGGWLRDAELVVRREVAFAAKPVLHFDAELIEGDAIADFEKAIGDRQGVVEDGVVGEVPHGKVIDPLDGAWMGCSSRVDAFDGEFAEKHFEAFRQRAGT